MEILTRLKNLLSENWLPKILCLLLAIGVWVVIRQDMKNDESAPPPYGPIKRSHP